MPLLTPNGRPSIRSGRLPTRTRAPTSSRSAWRGGVVIRDGNVAFAIEVEPERGPRLEPLRKAAEEAVEPLPDVLSVTAV
jgi:Iron-sulfur cluster assembly protein